MTVDFAPAADPAPGQIGTDELAGWLRLLLTPGVGNETARRLLAAFGPPAAVFAQPAQALEQIVAPGLARALAAEPPALAGQLARTLDWLRAPGAARHVLPLGHAWYPSPLLAMEDPPVLLYAMGRAGDLPHATSAVALVGSRNPTPQGTLNARQFARALAQAGWTVVSGLALGVDAAAHQGALDGLEDPQPGGAPPPRRPLATIAVVGTGLDRVYPKAHLALAREIARDGVILSEYAIGTPPLGANFPRRNRLIAGLSLGTLVVEAALQSGSLITARLASEQGKDVMAIPGSIHAPQSRGCHALIKQGAKLVECAQDVLEELLPQRAAPAASPRPAGAPQGLAGGGQEAAPDLQAHAEPARVVLRALGHDPVSLDALAARTGLDAAALQARLLELELDGEVGRLPGGLYQRLARA